MLFTTCLLWKWVGREDVRYMEIFWESSRDPCCLWLTCGNQEKENIIPDLEWTAGCLLRVLQLKVGNSSITITRELVRNAESQSPPSKTYWIRIWILTRSPGDSYPDLLHWQVNSLTLSHKEAPNSGALVQIKTVTQIWSLYNIYSRKKKTVLIKNVLDEAVKITDFIKNLLLICTF